MRNEPKMERLRVASLKELDALIGKYLTKEPPQIFWEEQQACLRFDSIEEALEAMHDPYFQQFIPRGSLPHSALTEVQEFRAYSSDLALAWELVEQVSRDGEILHMRREDGRWVAAFGDRPDAASRSAPVAISLAALRVCGIEAELVAEWTMSPTASRAVA